MEFKRSASHRDRQSQPTTPLHSNSRPHLPTPTEPATQRVQPIMSGRSLKSKQASKKSRSPLKGFLSSKKTIALCAVIVIVAIGLITINKSSQQSATSNKTEKNATKTTDIPTETTESVTAPTYQTVTPNSKSIDELGGWQRVSPSKSNPVFAYSDKIGDVAINVSQQPLPESFKKNTDTHIADLAKKFNATTKLDAGTTKAYIGTSAKGPQSVIFNEKNTLILIKSQKNIDNKAWIQYIISLK